MKTSTKRKAISKKEVAVKKKALEEELTRLTEQGYDIRNAKFLNQNEEWEDLEVPTLRKINDRDDNSDKWFYIGMAIIPATVSGMIFIIPKVLEVCN